MALSVAQLLAAAETCGEALRLRRAAPDVTQAHLVARASGTINADQISLIERGKRPTLSKQCTAVAYVLGLTDDDEAHRMLLALIDRAPERLKPTCVGLDSGAGGPLWRRSSRPIPRSSSQRRSPTGYAAGVLATRHSGCAHPAAQGETGHAAAHPAPPRLHHGGRET